MDAGLEHVEIARRLNMTIESYWDLESYDDEVFTVISLETLTELGRVLNVEPRRLLLGSDADGVEQIVSFDVIASRIRERIAHSGGTAEQFADSIGWDVNDVLRDPKALGGYNVEALYDICKSLALDWVEAIPTMRE